MDQQSVDEKNQTSKRRPVTVVGAGFSGLVCALYLYRRGFQVEVIERSDRVGGMISTTRTSFGLVESAANAFLNSPRVEELFEFLGLEVQAAKAESKRRYIFRWGWPRRWPLGFLGSLRFIAGVAGFFLIRRRLAPRPTETVRKWASRVFGREASNYLIEAALQGIYAGDVNRLSATLIFGKYFRAIEPKPAKPISVRGSVSAPNGMGTVVDLLRARLENLGVKFRLQAEVPTLTNVPRQPTVIATSALAAGALLGQIDLARADALRGIEMLTLYSVTASFKEALPFPPGFGCLFPPVEGRHALGVLLNNFIFPDRVSKGFSETWILGGAHPATQELKAASDQEIFERVLDERQGALHGSGDNFGYRVTRWEPGLPHYSVDLERRLPELRGLRFNTILAGNYLGEIGLARILELAARVAESVQESGEWT